MRFMFFLWSWFTGCRKLQRMGESWVCKTITRSWSLCLSSEWHHNHNTGKTWVLQGHGCYTRLQRFNDRLRCEEKISRIYWFCHREILLQKLFPVWEVFELLLWLFQSCLQKKIYPGNSQSRNPFELLEKKRATLLRVQETGEMKSSI